jgi:hypothetical protein
MPVRNVQYKDEVIAMTATVTYDESKFSELVLYVADKMKDDTYFGATVLNKVLFFADFFHYAEHGRSITGADYMRLDQGPVPRRLVPVRTQLVNQGRAAVVKRQIGPRNQNRLEVIQPAELESFSGPEIETVNKMIDLIKGHTASSISELSHTMLGWRMAADGESIPYESVFLYGGPITASDRQRAEAVASELGMAA